MRVRIMYGVVSRRIMCVLKEMYVCKENYVCVRILYLCVRRPVCV